MGRKVVSGARQQPFLVNSARRFDRRIDMENGNAEYRRDSRHRRRAWACDFGCAGCRTTSQRRWRRWTCRHLWNGPRESRYRRNGPCGPALEAGPRTSFSGPRANFAAQTGRNPGWNGGTTWREGRGDRDFDRGHRRGFRGFVFGGPNLDDYWYDYGPYSYDYDYDYDYDYGYANSCYALRRVWLRGHWRNRRVWICG